ncbi:hypothetical protein [uncultured Polaribacter sp.]|uniref:hypothetical protein n=1 Tax=uncultured Polaribacter sp. TaxID=174711 RepID=UPI00262D0FAB|nr:hypothetical protein [uncultured Polaribacter sp.]
MKSKLLPILLVVLVLLNGVLIFMLINKSRIKTKVSHRKFITKELNFSDDQNVKFRYLDQPHKETMMGLDDDIRKQRDLLFSSFSNTSKNLDSISKIIGALEAKKDLEIFRFFSSIRKICTKEQQVKFDLIIKQALKGGKHGPPRHGQKNHPHRERGMPPPPR